MALDASTAAVCRAEPRERTAATVACTSTGWRTEWSSYHAIWRPRYCRILSARSTRLEKVPTISDIFINPRFDSALEARFIESLPRLGGADGLPAVKLVQEIVFGKSGYLLEVGSERYWVEPQHELGEGDGVSMASCPDFLIWPANSRSIRRPIAVFCDGWAYHQGSLREDARKRSALVASGRFWVWSVTHEDVKAALSGETITDLESPLTALNRHGGVQAPDISTQGGTASVHSKRRGAVAQMACARSRRRGRPLCRAAEA